MKLLDLHCKAGGATKGYQRAGFYVTGIDIDPQPRYCGNEFIQCDSFEYLAKYWQEYDVIHISPMCQRYSLGTQRWRPQIYPDQLWAAEDALLKTGNPFIIENVERAPFRLPTFTLCGIQFGLKVIRHRKFATNFPVLTMPHSIRHPKRGEFVTCAGHGGNGSNKYSVWADAVQIDWMNKQELSQAVPWVYTEFIGKQLMSILSPVYTDNIHNVDKNGNRV